MYLIPRVVRFLRSEEGPTSIEYAVMLMFVLAALVVAVQLLGGGTGKSMGDSADKIGTAIGS